MGPNHDWPSKEALFSWTTFSHPASDEVLYFTYSLLFEALKLKWSAENNTDSINSLTDVIYRNWISNRYKGPVLNYVKISQLFCNPVCWRRAQLDVLTILFHSRTILIFTPAGTCKLSAVLLTQWNSFIEIIARMTPVQILSSSEISG